MLMANFTWNRFPIKNLLIDSLLTPIVDNTYLNHQKPEVVPDPDFRSRLRQDSAFFLRTRSQKFVKNRDPDPDSKSLEQEPSRSLKKWLRPPLLKTYKMRWYDKTNTRKWKRNLWTLHLNKKKQTADMLRQTHESCSKNKPRFENYWYFN